MNNKQLLNKMKNDMKIRNFSHYTYDAYLGKTKDIMKYFKDKQLEDVTTDELRDFLLDYLKNERKLSDRSINYYNSVIRFIYEVTLDKNGKGNGTIVVIGCVDKLKLDSAMVTAIQTANISGIVLTEGSAI